ncbi:hypothetical protein PC116_g22190 [Phytophthora cactorum]|nr:hypothetical protein PC116_g22190 [Phytophthora cactorum]
MEPHLDSPPRVLPLDVCAALSFKAVARAGNAFFFKC